VPTSHGLPPGQPPLAQARASGARKRLPHGARSLIEWGIVIGVAVVLALVVRSYVVQTFFIPSISMEPTLHVGDRILVFKAAYDFTSPAVGDVIVFHAPAAEHEHCSDPGVQDLVKRIIATPGQTIWSKANTIYYENPGSTTVHALRQPWQHTTGIGQAITKQTVPPSSYFVMGDNRGQSCDSRVWGYVPRSDIIGKAVLIFWPLSRLSII
jgi:signal peptidase I